MYLETIESPADLRRLNQEQLGLLAQEIRETLVHTVTENGGHLASNLGIVELTLALHAVFESPDDSLVWDVGHQSYVHKLLTGRRESFGTIRKLGGLSGFCSRDESEHDAFGAGHAATSVSAALGIATGKRLRGESGHTVAIIGDGSMTSGLAFEGMNNAGQLGSRLIVVLNDNEMSIAPSVGAITRYLGRARTDSRYHRAREGVEHALEKVPRGAALRFAFQRVRQALHALVMPSIIWEELGFTYVGPLDGHDIGGLMDVFRRVRGFDHPVLVHVLTTKGKGYGPAEEDAVALHGVSPRTSAKPPSAKVPTFTEAFAEALVAQARRDPRVVAITAAMPGGTGLARFAREFPDRCFDVGIAEAHAVTFAAGLAAQGLRPVVAVYSTFLQRAYDSIVHDVCIQRLPVVLALDRAGLVGDDGRTHHGVFDLAYLRSLPGMTVMAPSDERELGAMLATALALPGPAALRYPRGSASGCGTDREPQPVPVGCGRVLREGSAVAIIAIGQPVRTALDAAERLAARGISAAVVDARFAKPLDAELILGLARRIGLLVTVEEHALAGGFGGAVAELLADAGLMRDVGLVRIGIGDAFVEHGTQLELRQLSGLTPELVAERVLSAFPQLALVTTR